MGIERNGSLEFGHADIVLSLKKQHTSDLSASSWQAGNPLTCLRST